jgi:hypothetical protein
MIDKEFKAKWLDALRNAYKDKQGRHRLRPAADTFCCLGVACDLAAPDMWVLLSDYRVNPLSSRSEALYEFSDNECFMPPWLINQIEITSREVRILADMNDEGKSFAEIADWIEANL